VQIYSALLGAEAANFL